MQRRWADGGRQQAGHRSAPHTADLRIEAWAPSREGCLVQAVLGMVESFLDISAARPGGMCEYLVPAGPDADMLVAALEEVIFRIDTTGQVPVAVTASRAADGVRLACSVANAEQLPLIGAVPKAVALHDLRMQPGSRGWECTVTLDV